jgi:hypothetical protein
MKEPIPARRAHGVEELGLGWPAPIDAAIPELAARRHLLQPPAATSTTAEVAAEVAVEIETPSPKIAYVAIMIQCSGVEIRILKSNVTQVGVATGLFVQVFESLSVPGRSRVLVNPLDSAAMRPRRGKGRGSAQSFGRRAGPCSAVIRGDCTRCR